MPYPEGVQPLSLYIHIPFCLSKCPYCDFNTYAGIEELMPSYCVALREEIERWGEALGQPTVHTIFLGGGTPSYIPLEETQAILSVCRSSFRVLPEAEVSLEANPGDLTPALAEGLLSAGVNRLSIGVQSFKEPLLKLLGRRHSASEAIDAYRAARMGGFRNINLDLIFGLPRQSRGDWQDTLSKALDLRPEHLSLYCLTLEEGTPFKAWVERGQLPHPDPDLAADMYSIAEGMLKEADYRQYEISNWALPGRECRHNLTYWRNLPYLGVGAGAHSYLPGLRFSNERPPGKYISRIQRLAHPTSPIPQPTSTSAISAVAPIAETEQVDSAQEMAETMMLGLRLNEGVSLEGFRRRFGKELRDCYSPQIDDLTSLGLLALDNGCVRLTSRGRLLGNEVFVRFL